MANNSSDNLTVCVEEAADLNQEFIYAAVLISVLYIVILSFLEEREWKKEYCGGRPGLVVPVNFLDGYQKRWSYAFVLSGFAGDLTRIIFNSVAGSSGIFPQEAYENRSLAVLLLLVDILAFTLINYPMLACLTTQYTIVGSVMGLLYTVFRICGISIPGLWCVQFISTNTTWEINVTVSIFMLAVSYLCYSLLCWCFSFHLVKGIVKFIRHRRYGQHVDDQNKTIKLAEHFQIRRTRSLLSKDMQPAFKEKKRTDWILYHKEPNFKYTTRIVVTFFVSFTLTYIVIALALYLSIFLIKNFGDQVTSSTEGRHIFTIMQVSFYIALAFVTLLSHGNLYASIKAYRRHMMSLYCGDWSFMASKVKEDITPARKLEASMRYSSYLIAYSLWGSIIQLFFISIAVFGVIYLLYAIFSSDSQAIFSVLQLFVAPSAIILSLFVLQILASRLVFLQGKVNPEDKDKPLAVRHRKILHNLAFYLFFWNMVLGLVSSLRRVLVTAVVGIGLIGRMDRCVMMKGFETMDRGYRAYTGMLEVEYSHTHPVMRTFCHLLMRQINEPTTESLAHKKACQRWNVAYTLLKNPKLQEYRYSYIQLNRSESFEMMERNQDSLCMRIMCDLC